MLYFEPFRKQLKKVGYTQIPTHPDMKPFETGNWVTGCPLQCQSTGARSDLLDISELTDPGYFKTAGAALRQKPDFLLLYAHTPVTVYLMNGDRVLSACDPPRQQILPKRSYRFCTHKPYRESLAPLVGPRRAFNRPGWCLDLDAIPSIERDRFVLTTQALIEELAPTWSEHFTLAPGEALVWENALYLHKLGKSEGIAEIFWFTRP